jgi:hypothetical protein
MSCSAAPWDWVSCGEQLVGKAASSAASDAFSQIAHDFASTADHVTAWLWGEMSQATAVTLGGRGWGTYLGITFGLAAAVGAGLFMIQVIASALRRDVGGMGRAFRGLLVAFIAGAAAVSVAEICLQAADAVSDGVMQVGLGTNNWSAVGDRLVALSVTSYGPAALLLVSLFMIASTVLVWLALTIRKLLLIITAIFAPVAFCGSLSDVTASWVRKWIEYTAALIFSKVILVIIFVAGLGVLDNGLGQAGDSGTQQATQLMTGLLILCLAGIAPWMAVKVVHFAGDSFHAIHAQGAAAAAVATTTVMAPQKIQRHISQLGIASPSGARTWAPPSSNGSTDQNQPKTTTTTGSDNGAATGSAPGTAATAGAVFAAAEVAKKTKDAAVDQVSQANETAAQSNIPSCATHQPGPPTPIRHSTPPASPPSIPPPPPKGD